MKVLQVMALHPSKLGSFEEYILCFAKKMCEMNHKSVFVFSGDPHPFLQEKLDEYKADYYVEQTPINTIGLLRLLFRLIQLIHNSKIDVVQGQFHPYDHISMLAGFLSGTRSYRTIHTTTFSSIRKLKYSSIIAAKMSSYFSKSTFAVSGAVKKDLIDNLGIKEDKIKVLYNGINLMRYLPKSGKYNLHSELGIKDSDKIILSVAHSRPEKGLQYLVKAAPSVIESHPNTHFVFCGGGPEDNQLLELAKSLGIGAKIHFLGPRSDVPELLNCSYLLVQPSLVEALGLSALEAMATEKAVVASNVEGLPEAIEDNVTGILVPPKDPSTLAKALSKLLYDPELCASMGKMGRKRVKNLFDLDNRIVDEIKIYEQELS